MTPPLELFICSMGSVWRVRSVSLGEKTQGRRNFRGEEGSRRTSADIGSPLEAEEVVAHIHLHGIHLHQHLRIYERKKENTNVSIPHVRRKPITPSPIVPVTVHPTPTPISTHAAEEMKRRTADSPRPPRSNQTCTKSHPYYSRQRTYSTHYYSACSLYPVLRPPPTTSRMKLSPGSSGACLRRYSSGSTPDSRN